MNIEEYWSDIDVYYISFITKNGNDEKRIDKLIAFDCSIDRKDIETSIYTYFNNVISIEHIDYWDDGLLKNKNF